MIDAADIVQPLAEQLSLFEKIIGSAVFGLILGLSCPGFGVWWLAWCAAAPFLVLIRASTTWKEAIAVGFSFGFAYNLLTLYWLLGFHLAGLSPQITIVLAAITLLVDATAKALPYAGLSLLLYALPMRAGIFPHHQRPFFPYILSVPIAWIFFEYLSGPIIGIRINELCYSQSAQLQLLQIARLGGAKLITFLIVLSNTALAQLLTASANFVQPLGKRTDRLLPTTGSLIDLMTVILLAALCALIGRGSEGSCLNTHVPAIAVSIYGTDAGDAISVEGRAIVAGTAASAGVNQAALSPDKLLYTRTHRSYLSTIFSLPNQVLSFVYPAASNILKGYMAGIPNGSAQVVNTAWGRIGISTGVALTPAVLIKEEVQQGAGLLVCIVDPSCFHSTILDRQILAAAVLRAIENGRYLVLCAGQRISAVIDPCGKIVMRSIPGNTGILKEQIRFLYRNTYFSNVDFN